MFVLAALTALGVWTLSMSSVGAKPSGQRLERIRNSPQWKGEAFGNPLQRVDGSFLNMVSEFFFGGSEHRVPSGAIEPLRRKRTDFDRPPKEGLRITWLGHSTMLVEIDGARVLIDPVWGQRASPFAFAGPKRFYAPPLPIGELPDLDAIVISHDHYDHLDHETVVSLRGLPVQWVVPLGVGAHLARWGIEAQRVAELDWWEATEVAGLTLTCTPARHFSGRSAFFTDQNATLWAGWALAGPEHRVFYSGDTAMHPSFADIGERLGPFDVGMFEVGAYNKLWADVHLGPEQAVVAHKMVGSRIMLPVHWGLFDLALHGWTEPIERTLAFARQEHVTVVTPRPGGSFEIGDQGEAEVTRWWPDVPWQTYEQAPAWSSAVDELLMAYR